MSIIIAAIPAEDEKVHKISSEKVPHLTLAHLGDAVADMDIPDIVTFVQHVATHLDPFYLSVDYRGTLGDKDADVLFFENNLWELPRLKEFRHHLLLNEAIKRAYDSADQFPEWQPHLTLGYPDAPAHKDPNDDPPRFYGIHFDRIAVWFGDYEGTEIRLKYDYHGDTEVAMHSTVEIGAGLAEDFLAHYGTKGMKWGVRNADKAQAKIDKAEAKGDAKTVAKQTAKRDKALNEADEKWQKSVYTTHGAVQVHNAMADHFNDRIASINDKYPDVNIIDRPDADDTKAYLAEVGELENRSYAHAVKAVHGSSPSTRKEAIFVNDENGARIEIRDKKDEAAHADFKQDDLIVLLKLSAGGKIVEANKAELAAEHSSDSENFLAHYGVKGMKWGVTRVDRAASVTKISEKESRLGGPAKDVTVTQTRPGRYVKTKGGQRQQATDEAIKAAAGRQKAKKSTTDALTNDELRASIERMNLEQQFIKLSRKTDRITFGRRLAESLLSIGTLNVASDKN